MSALGPKKKNQLFIMLGAAVGVIVISVILDIMTNNGGRVILVGAIAGVVIAAALFLAFNLLAKKKADADADGELSEETRFTRNRRNKERENNFFEEAGFDAEFTNDTYEDEIYEDDMVIEPQISEEEGNNSFVPPSQQLREKGFFGRMRAEETEEPLFEEEEDISWNEPEYEEIFEPEYEPQYENDEFSDDEFEAPVIAFGDPVPAEDTFEEEAYSEVQLTDEENGQTEDEASEEFVPAEEDIEASFEEVQYAEPEAAAEEVQDTIPSEPQNNLLLKDINPGMVIASQAPGQTLESFYADMSEEDIIYRDCVEVWSSAAKNPMLKILEKLKNIEDKKVAGELGRDCEYVNAMIDRMLYFTQLEMIDQALNMQVYNYSMLVKECLKRFSPFFTEKKISLLWKGLDVNVITDKRWFIFAMTQIIFNSIEFTPHGGKIAVSAKKTEDYVDLIIDDSGEGVDEEELPYVFTAGFMGDDAPNPDDTRTGMGLFITRSVLQKLGGECMAESSKGKGMRIVIRLPAMKEETES